MKSIVERLSKLHTTSLSDALNQRNVMASYIRPLREGSLLIGRAYTVRPAPGDHTSVVKALATAEKGEVLVIDGADTPVRLKLEYLRLLTPGRVTACHP